MTRPPPTPAESLRCNVTVWTTDHYGRRCLGPCWRPAMHYFDYVMSEHTTIRYAYCGGCVASNPRAIPIPAAPPSCTLPAETP